MAQDNAQGREPAWVRPVTSNGTHAFSRVAVAAGSQAHARVQPKLRVSAPGDVYEQEADRVAEHVVRMPAVDNVAIVEGNTAARGECPGCGSGDEAIRRKSPPRRLGSLVQRHVGQGNAEPTSGSATAIGAMKVGGQPLSEPLRRFFEPRFGYDFSHVRIHTDPPANESAKGLNALAYTCGNDVVFGSGQYRPATEAGKRLLAHELAHVIQQRDDHGRIQRKENKKSPCSIHAYDASNPKDTAVIPKDESGIGVLSVSDMVSKVNAYVDDDRNACSCVSRLEINGHGGDGRQHVGTGGSHIDDEKVIAHNSTDEHLSQLTKIKFCSRALFMLLGCHVGRGKGKDLLSKLANLLPGKLIGGAQHYTAGTGLGRKKVTGAGDEPAQPMRKRDPFLTSPHVRWHLIIDGKEYVIPGNETTTSEGKSKLKAADKIKVKTPDGGMEVIK